MCILVVKNKGVKAPDAGTVRMMCENNPDGFGMAVLRDGKIEVMKTFDVGKYVRAVTAVPDGCPAVFHMRIATHGSVRKSNCHPFVSQSGRWAFAHNGILSGVRNEGDWTDSETFFRRIALPVLKSYAITSSTFESCVRCVIGSSKFAFLDARDGVITTFGDFIEDKGGLLFSNTTYKASRWTYRYGGGYDWDSIHGGHSAKGSTSAKALPSSDAATSKNAGPKTAVLDGHATLLDECIECCGGYIDYYGAASYADVMDEMLEMYPELTPSEVRACFDEAMDLFAGGPERTRDAIG